MGKGRKKAMKRSYLKRFSAGYINTGRSINKIGMESLYGGSVLPLNSDPFLRVVFGADSNKGGPSREEALELRKKILEGTDPRYRDKPLLAKVSETAKFIVTIGYVDMVSMHCYLYRTDKRTNVVMKSVSYGSKARAIQALKLDKVLWLEQVSPTPDP
jgi:hypothetical protein